MKQHEMGRIFSAIMWAGKAVTFCLGLALVLALTTAWQIVTATATGAGNTSELSAPRTVTTS